VGDAHRGIGRDQARVDAGFGAAAAAVGPVGPVVEQQRRLVLGPCVASTPRAAPLDRDKTGSAPITRLGP